MVEPIFIIEFLLKYQSLAMMSQHDDIMAMLWYSYIASNVTWAFLLLLVSLTHPQQLP